jgi:hypothetical protein
MSHRPSFRSILPAALAPMAIACTIDVHVILDGPGDALEDPGGSDSETTGDTDDHALPDLPEAPAPTQAAHCMVPAGELVGPLPCDLSPPSEVIALTTAWTWTGPAGEDSVLTTPLVANLNDDNGDGFVDLCDTPDLVVAAVALPPGKTDVWPEGHLHVIDGGGAHASFAIATPIDASVNPALGDLTGDGVAEIVALQAAGPNSPYASSPRRLVAFSAAGELLWTGEHWQASRGGGALAIADLDNDGSPEIIAPEYVATADGALAWVVANPPPSNSMPVAVDLDLDGRLELLFGATAYAADGTWLFDASLVPHNRGSVAVANFDDDPYPELYVQHEGEHWVFEHDGSLKATCPTGNLEVSGAGGYPVSATDIDGDGRAELLFGYHDRFYVLEIAADTCSLRWSQKVDADVGLSSGTMFDLLGDGSTEAIYADRSRVQLFSSTGELLFVVDRSARESITNPIVVDVNGDGAAEIVITSSRPVAEDDPASRSPTVIVLSNAEGPFVATRRVWNQHTYHHSNVGEDGQIPAYEAPHWLDENGFRVNPRSYSGDLCIPK